MDTLLIGEPDGVELELIRLICALAWPEAAAASVKTSQVASARRPSQRSGRATAAPGLERRAMSFTVPPASGVGALHRASPIPILPFDRNCHVQQ